MNISQARLFLNSLLQAALDAANPRLTLPRYLGLAKRKLPVQGKTLVLGAGKASASMAKAMEENWEGPLEGLVVTRYGHDLPPGERCQRIRVVEASHPVPDEAGRKAAEEILQLAKGLTADDLLICLISGGGSSLLSLPAKGVSLEEKCALNKQLLKSGANIAEMNCVRKHLSAIKGGQLALAAAPAQVITYMISDVPGDDPSVIASGPTVANPTSFSDARAILDKYAIEVTKNVLEHFNKGEKEALKQKGPKLSNPCFADNETCMIATPQASLEAAAKAAEAAGIFPVILSDSIEGEARDVAGVMAAMARQVAHKGQPFTAPCVLLSGGETTVTVRGNGRGGRNTEFLLSLAIELEGEASVFAIAADTDGIDGVEDNAGAIVTPETLARAEAKAIRAKDYLANNDAYGFFDALDDLIVTGPTLTNVNDFRAILIVPKG